MLEPSPKNKYPAGVYIYVYRKKKYSNRAPYRIYRLVNKKLKVLPIEIFDTIKDDMNSFNTNKRYYRNKVGKEGYTWEDFEKDLDRLIKYYRQKIEKYLEKKEWPKEDAPYIIPLLYNWQEPKFEDEPKYITDADGDKIKVFVTK
jgi:hypothetical protein